MLRVRSFTQDDAHLFVREDQIEAEIAKVLELIAEFYTHFGFEYKVELSTRPEEFMGSKAIWDDAEAALESVLKKKAIAYQVNHGDGAFYGPKIDFHILDSLGRSWQCGTVQLDFLMPEKFNCSYVGKEGQFHRPVMIHRAIFGSVERFMAILIEHYAGDFPLWLSPVQAKIIPIAESHIDYAENVKSRMESAGFRVEIDDRDEKMGLKIREAEKQKVPYMLVIGDMEIENESVAIRQRKNGNLGVRGIQETIDLLKGEIFKG